MGYVISGLPLQAFQPLFDLDDAALRARGIVRQVADAKPGFPCRITLQDAEPGERRRLHALLDALVPLLYASPQARRVRWSLDVDPVDLY